VSGPYVVILTGGALPGQKMPEPSRNDIDVALQRAGLTGTGAGDSLARRIAVAAIKLGYEHGARDYRVVAAYVVDGKDDAQRFAEFVTREIDPAYVTAARSPLDELYAAVEELHRRDQVTGDGAQ
jgi:hypothetical protein